VDTANTASAPSTTTSSAHPERFTIREVLDTIRQSKAKPLLVADGDAFTLAKRLLKYGKKQISIVVLG
jgi:hypothetical protein